MGAKAGEPRSRIDVGPEGYRLTPRECEVLALLLRRYSNAEIAEALQLSPRTVKNHVGKVFVKLGVRRRAELFKGFLGGSRTDVAGRERLF